MLQVLNKHPSPGLSGEALLADCLPLVCSFPQNQALMCLQARQQMQLGRLHDVLQTVAAFLGCNNDVAASRWALHLTVHVHWLTGDLDQVCCHFQPEQLAETGSDLLANVPIQSCKLCIASQLASSQLSIVKLGNLYAADVVCVASFHIVSFAIMITLSVKH
jgi:hypothetical protein